MMKYFCLSSAPNPIFHPTEYSHLRYYFIRKKTHKSSWHFKNNKDSIVSKTFSLQTKKREQWKLKALFASQTFFLLFHFLWMEKIPSSHHTQWKVFNSIFRNFLIVVGTFVGCLHRKLLYRNFEYQLFTWETSHEITLLCTNSNNHLSERRTQFWADKSNFYQKAKNLKKIQKETASSNVSRITTFSVLSSRKYVHNFSVYIRVERVEKSTIKKVLPIQHLFEPHACIEKYCMLYDS